MNYQELHKQLLELSEKYTLVKGMFEIHDGILIPIKPDDCFVFLGGGDDQLIADSLNEALSYSELQDGYYEYSATLTWDKGQKGEYGRYELPPGFEVEYYETKRIEGDVLPGFSGITETDF